MNITETAKLYAARGKPKTTRSVRTVVDSSGADTHGDVPPEITIEALRREHSRKPEAAYLAAEQLMPGAARVELFARTRRPGWEAFGKEMDRFMAEGEGALQ